MLARLILCITVALFLAVPARADWYEASSDHFVIYADQSEKQVQKFADRLERYHAAVEYLLMREGKKPSPSNRVTVYVVQNADQVRKLFGGDNRYVAGFYVPRAGGTIAIVPRVKSGESEYDLSGERVLLHEYAHHVMYGESALSYPLWYSEGFAEFLASAGFEKDGGVGLGKPAMHRAYELFQSKNVPIERLLDTKAYLAKRDRSKEYDEFYGRSWLLFHYLTFSNTRKGQLRAYLSAIRKGATEIDAAREVFGDLKLLDKELERYQNASRMNYLPLKPELFKTSSISVRPLDAAESAVMPLVIRSRRGVDEEGAAKLLPEVRAVAAKFPNSAPVMAALAEAEYDAGNDDAAIAAADKASAVDPKNINALIQKGYAMARKAQKDGSDSKAWPAVRKQFLAINKIENDHPIPLVRFYQTYVESGVTPTDNAIDGLVWALSLAPFDRELRMNVGNALLNKERYADAITALKPIASDAHAEEMGEVARTMISVAETKLAEKAEAAAAAATPAKKAK
jgi:tetratricopeptide (TPR) repeat protein